MWRNKIVTATLSVIVLACALALFMDKSNRTTVAEGVGKTFTKQETASDLEVVSFISPHHLVANKLIDGIFSEVSRKNTGKKIDRIILLSPDHFNKKSGWGFVSDREWNIGDKKIMADQETAKELSETGFITKDNELFKDEHGITALLPYVEKYFPKVKIVPIILKNELPKEKAERLAEFIGKLKGNNLLLLSSDFSHYLDKNIAELHDKKAIEVIEEYSFDDIYQLETDFVSGLYVALRYAQLEGYGKFQLFDNSSSSKIGGKNFIGENTSYVTGYFEKGTSKKTAKSANILFFGDLMLDRYVREIIGKKGASWLTQEIERLFWSQDVNVANLEGPITNKSSVAIGTEVEDGNHFVFTFEPDSVSGFLQKNRINVVNIGNNHILNFGVDGLEQTKNNLQNSETDYFGDPLDANNVLIKEVNGRNIGLVNYNQFSKISAAETGEKIKEVKSQSDFVIVYTHWGTEYQLTQNKSQKEKAHAFIDAGADLIIGSHPHVVQPLEIYQGKMIFYSLGNFIFDQYFSEDTKTMLAVSINISDNNVEAILMPLYQGRDGQLELADEQKQQALLKRLAENSSVDNSVKNEIIGGRIKLEIQ